TVRADATDRRWSPITDHCRIKMSRQRSRQLELPVPPTWGGPRPGAGRKPSTTVRPGPPHAQRPTHCARHPVHVTMRARTGVPSFGWQPIFLALVRALTRSSGRWFRLTHFSAQTDHLHLIVEADSGAALIRGVQGLAVRCAHAINRAADRHGPVWTHRYHA